MAALLGSHEKSSPQSARKNENPIPCGTGLVCRPRGGLGGWERAGLLFDAHMVAVRLSRRRLPKVNLSAAGQQVQHRRFARIAVHGRRLRATGQLQPIGHPPRLANYRKPRSPTKTQSVPPSALMIALEKSHSLAITNASRTSKVETMSIQVPETKILEIERC
jgi:hypothetical protein